MKIIFKLTDEDFNLDIKPFDNPRCRMGARGIVLNDEGKIAVLNKSKKNEFKLIGGGIENNEDPEVAFKREVLEEAGCEVEIDELLGIVIEEKSQDNFKQTSYVFLSHVTNDTKELHLTKKEIEEGSKLLWMDIDDALNSIKNSENNLVSSKYENVYHTKFIVRRDYKILKYYKTYKKLH